MSVPQWEHVRWWITSRVKGIVGLGILSDDYSVVSREMGFLINVVYCEGEVNFLLVGNDF